MHMLPCTFHAHSMHMPYITQKLVGVREDCGVLEARKADRSALAELGKTLHEAFHGGLEGLEKQLGGMVGAAPAPAPGPAPTLAPDSSSKLDPRS